MDPCGLPEYLDDGVGHEEVEDDRLGLHPGLAVDQGEQPDVPAGHLDTATISKHELFVFSQIHS